MYSAHSIVVDRFSYASPRVAPGQLPAEMTRKFAHPSSLTTQPEEKLKAQPIIAAKLLLRRKIGGAVGKGFEQQHIGAACLTLRPAPGRIRGLLDSLAVFSREAVAAAIEKPHTTQVPPCRLRGQHSFASSNRRVTSKHLSRSRLFLKGSWDSFREQRRPD